jgi:hypothetical protein
MTNHHENFQAMMPFPRIISPTLSKKETSKQAKFFNSPIQQFKSEVKMTLIKVFQIWRTCREIN